MKIGEFTDSFLPIADGVGRVVYNYARGLAALGQECYVVAPMNKTGYRGDFSFELIEYTSRPAGRSSMYRMGLPAFDKHYNDRIDMVNLDIVHVHSPFTAGAAGTRAATKKKIPLVGTFHSKYYDDFLQVTKSKLLAQVGTYYVVKFYERCDEVWTMNEASAETLRSYGYKGRIQIVPNGTEVFPLLPGGKEAVRQKFGLPEGVPVFLFVGQMNWKKNIARILEACRALQEKGCDFRLVFAGQGPHMEEIRQKTFEYRLQDKTVFAGHVSDKQELSALYAVSSLFVFPSLYDTSGLVTKEAACVSTPSVAIRGSGAAGGIIDGENGFLCEDDSASLSSVLFKAYDDPGALLRAGLNAEKTLVTPWPDVMKTIRSLYEELVEKKKAERMRA